MKLKRIGSRALSLPERSKAREFDTDSDRGADRFGSTGTA